MTRDRAELERIEARSLAPYAQASAHSRGRLHEEEAHSRRTDFQRDRDRIVHSRAFRRLEYKTQVFLNPAGDHYRTRLTHTIEVASIARGISRSLGLNQDLAEAISLAHDLGHPPFGHSGENTLNELMKEHGGFEHNKQSLRVVEDLELKYPEFNGLNLTYEVLEGLAKPHGARFMSEPAPAPIYQPSLEASVADLADEIAYVCHDLDDGFEAGLLSAEEIADQPLWRQVEWAALKSYPRLEGERGRSYIQRCLLDHLVQDAISSSERSIREAGVASAQDVRHFPKKLIHNSEEIAHSIQSLRQFLGRALYHHPSVRSVNQRACLCLTQLFKLLTGHPHLLSPQFSLRIKKEGVHRATCDYLACMTDRYALQQYEKLIGRPVQIESVSLRQPALF